MRWSDGYLEFSSIVRTMSDRAGEAKASGNLGNTLKVLGRYDEAIVCCERHLELAKCMADKVNTVS